jgi:hypothetical protein
VFDTSINNNNVTTLLILATGFEPLVLHIIWDLTLKLFQALNKIKYDSSEVLVCNKDLSRTKSLGWNSGTGTWKRKLLEGGFNQNTSNYAEEITL